MKKGSVLILALWALFFLGALAVSVGARAAACIKLAEHMKTRTAIDRIARAGVERAVAAVRTGKPEEMAGPESEYWSRDNSSVEGGIFTVSAGGGFGDQSVTNFGVVCESVRTNINNMAEIQGLFEAVANEAVAARLLESVRQYRIAKKLLTKGSVNGKFQSIYELLLVDGMTDDLFEEMLPFITVFDRNCYRGVSSARIMDAASLEGGKYAEGQIMFVFDVKKDSIVFWEQ